MKIYFTLVLFAVFLFCPRHCLSNELIAKSDEIKEKQTGLTTEDIATRAYFDRIKKAIENKEYKWLSLQFEYPVCLVNHEFEQKANNPQQLLKFIDVIFTDDVNKKILNQKRDEICLGDMGYMISNGVIWFDVGKIHSVLSNDCSANNCNSTYISYFPLKPPEKPYADLEGDWKMIDYQIRFIGAIGEDEAKANLGKIASIRSSVITLNSFGRNFKCTISPHPKIEKRGDAEFWDRKTHGKGTVLFSYDFGFSDPVFVYETVPVGNKFYDLREIVVDKTRQKMILMCAESGFYLFERIEK